MSNYRRYLQYATDTQKKYINAVMEHGTQAKAAIALGVNIRTLEKGLARLKLKGGSSESIKVRGGRTHLVIPDMQITPTTPTDHLTWIGKYINEERPDVLINIGDWADMEALSYYDHGKKTSEGKRVSEDIKAANAAMDIMMKEIKYEPEKHFTMGNHEDRVTRHIDSDARMEGLLSLDHLNYADHGWKVHAFKKPVEVDGVAYCHYFYNAGTGKPIGGKSIYTRIQNIGYTFTMGHQQGLIAGMKELSNGRILRGLVAGSGYLHDEDYIGPQANGCWRGILVKHEVFDGMYDLMEVSLNYLCIRYEGVPVWEFMRDKYPDLFKDSPWLQRQAARYRALG